MRLASRRQALAAFAATLAGAPALAQAPRRDTIAWRPVAVRAERLSGFAIGDAGRKQFGPLTFLGGLEMRGDLPEFGGISSAVMEPNGLDFTAASDQAHWITGRLQVDGEGQLTGVTQVRVAAMIAPNGRRMKDTRFFDTEGMVRIGNRLLVSVERVHQIIRFEIGADGPGGRGVLAPSPEGLRELNSNQGIEALGVMPTGSRAPGALIGIAERGRNADDIPGWIFSGPGAGSFQVARTRDFDVTDLGFLPSGDMILLERRFSPFWGIAFRLRRIPLARIAAGARLDGETIIEANMAYQIDNMEALTIHRAADGRTLFTLFSDDNFSVLQRNLVLRFAYSE